MATKELGGTELQKLKRSHSPSAIMKRLDGDKSPGHLRDFIYGAIDGAVTTFAVVSGVAGAGLSDGLVIIMGVANLIADGFSMAVSNYLASRAEAQQLEKARTDEERQIRVFPEGEREEIRQIFIRKGFSGSELETIVEVITSDEHRWVDTMLQEEHGLAINQRSAVGAALATFVAFILVGAIPLGAFCLNWLLPGTLAHPFAVSAAMTGAAFFLVGAFKSRFVIDHWLKAGIETLVVGGCAAALAYVAALLLKNLVPL